MTDDEFRPNAPPPVLRRSVTFHIEMNGASVDVSLDEPTEYELGRVAEMVETWLQRRDR